MNRRVQNTFNTIRKIFTSPVIIETFVINEIPCVKVFQEISKMLAKTLKEIQRFSHRFESLGS